MKQEKITSEKISCAARLFRFWLPRVLAMGVGLILLTAGLIKALDMELFIRQIKDYGIISHRAVLVPSAWALIVLECALGVGLLVLYRPRWVFSLTALLFLVFVGATSWAWLTGVTGDCGCYGALLKHTPGQALVENLILLAATTLAGVAYWHTQRPWNRTKTLTIAMACLIGLGLPLVSGFPPLGLNQSESNLDEETVNGLLVQGLEQENLSQGPYLIVLMGTDCLHCQEAIPELNMLAETPDLPPVVALCTSEESECLRFTNDFQPCFPIRQITQQLFWRLLADGDMPRVILLHNGRIKQVWDMMVPDEDAVRAELTLSAGGLLEANS